MLRVKAAFACTILLLSFFAGLLRPAGSAELEVAGDHDLINVVVHLYPGTDMYGFPSVNPDGSFYPKDTFWIKYNVYIYGNVDFDGVEAKYDKAAFELTRDLGWGSTSGAGLFAVRANARPGVYRFKVEAKASTKVESDASGSIDVTVGGVDVNAYYRAECRLTISASGGGTTDPEPGSYWYEKGKRVSVTAIPDANYTLSYWILDGTDSGSSNPMRVVMDKPHSITAVFEALPQNQSEVQVAEQAAQAVKHQVAASMAESTSKKSSSNSPAVLASSTSGPKLVIKDFMWTTWFDMFRGTVCQANGRLCDSDGYTIKYSDVVVEFRKKNFWTGEVWIVSKTVKTCGDGRFAVEDTCNPLFETFLGVRAWAEKPGYIPSWSLNMNLDPCAAEVGQRGAFLAGIHVGLFGRYTPVPVDLSVENVTSGCAVILDPASGQVDGTSTFEGAMLIRVDWNATMGKHEFYAVASSGNVSDMQQFLLIVKETECIPSAAVFRAYGLDPDAYGLALTLDGSIEVYAWQLTYIANWNAPTEHSYTWSSMIDSEMDGKRYILERVVVVTHYMSRASATVQVVEYDPHFTTTLVYTIPKSPGINSYEKQFAVIIRYDGNGPKKNLEQRAVMENWDWYGYASRIAVQQQLAGLTDFAGFSNPGDVAGNLKVLQQLFNLTNGVTFSASGIDEGTEGSILRVDGEAVTIDQLPKTYSWPENTTHTYEWSTQMPVYKLIVDPTWGTSYRWRAEDEWFSFEYAFIQLPQLNASIKISENLSLDQLEKQALSFSSRLYSPSGKIASTSLGNKITGVYSHNRLLESIAGDAGVGHDALKCIGPQFPIFFNNDSRYAKLIFDLDDGVAAEAIGQQFNSSIIYEISFTSNMFSVKPHTYMVNYTCELEYYRKAVNATAFKWDSAAERWTVDRSVRIEAEFDSAFNATEADWFMEYLRDQTADEVALDMATEDIYECHLQYFEGLGSTSGVMNRTSAYYYNLNITAGHGSAYLGVEPSDMDAWTEAVESRYAYWDSPSCTVSADTNKKTAGAASVRVDGDGLSTACTILHLLRPVNAFMEGQPADWGKLIFDIYLGGGCSGNITVMLRLSSGTVIVMNETVEAGAWRTVLFPAAGRITAVGIYCELKEPSGQFWIDRLRFSKVLLWRWEGAVSLSKTVYVNFASDKPYMLYVNMDPSSPLLVNVTKDDDKASRLTVDAPPELGGLESVTVYAVTSAPAGYSLKNIPVGSLQLRRLYSVNLTAPEEPIRELSYSSYRGYSAIHGGVLGFSGQTELLIIKDSEMRALPGYNATLLLIEAKNVWGTTFRTVVAVNPWAKTFWELFFEQIATVLIWIAIAAVAVGIIVKLLRESWGQL